MGNQVRLFVIFTNMLSFIYKSAFEEALQMCRKGSSREEILRFLVTAAEKVSGPDTVSSILLLDVTIKKQAPIAGACFLLI